MLYPNPATVLSPTQYVTDVDVLFDGGEASVSIANVTWEGNSCLAIRWNVARREWDDPDKSAETKTCVGMPTSRGYPVWFILPPELFDPESDMAVAVTRFLRSQRVNK